MHADVDTQLKQSRAFLQEYQDHLHALENGESFEPLLTAKKKAPKKAASDKAESVSDSDSDSMKSIILTQRLQITRYYSYGWSGSRNDHLPISLLTGSFVHWIIIGCESYTDIITYNATYVDPSGESDLR